MGKILVMMMVTMMMIEMVRVEGEQSSSEAPAVVQPRLSYLVYALGEVVCNAWSMQCSWYAILYALYVISPIHYPWALHCLKQWASQDFHALRMEWLKYALAVCRG